jgi:4-diphosphocytidyl-2-C-methyl-D-erythritol kinase
MEKTFWAPAKINLCLHVCGRRPDGYHELGMIMQRISLYDRIDIAVREGRATVACGGMELAPGEENIAARAARRLLDLSGLAREIDIRIDKRIPMAAGLGGGSSDAATVLLALNELLGLHLDRRALMREGLALGADVPFFLFENSAWATGIGEILEPFPLPAAWYVLVNPGVAVSTAWVYRNLALTTPGTAARMPGFPRTALDLAALLRNDLERVTAASFPVVNEVKELLLSSGAAGALMSGSGPTVFGLFTGEAVARSAAEALAARPGWRVFVVEPV